MSKALWWWIDNDTNTLQAESRYHDDGSPLAYVIEGQDLWWIARFEGHTVKEGSLEECMAACACAEDDVIHDWIYEDELPDGYDYAANYESSQVIDGVRMFPRNRGKI